MSLQADQQLLERSELSSRDYETSASTRETRYNSDDESEADETSELTYFKTLSPAVFHSHAFFLHVSTLIFALSLKQIDFIFDLVGAVMVSISIFLFPAVGYIFAYLNYPQSQHRAGRSSLCLASIFLVLGVALIVAAVTLNALKVMGKIPKDGDKSSHGDLLAVD